MTVRAKFVVNTITRSMYQQWDGSKTVWIEIQSVKLFPTTSGDTPENKEFFASTPSGSIELNIVNPAAVEQFASVLGRSVYVDFTPAED